jgi:hypothetical protein
MFAVLTDESERTADRMEAARWLADRAFGRPVQGIELDVEPRDDWADLLSNMSADDLNALIGIFERYHDEDGRVPVPG